MIVTSKKYYTTVTWEDGKRENCRWLTWYFVLYSLTTEAWANRRLCTAIYGSIVELPTVQLMTPNGLEHLAGGNIALS